VPERVAAGGVGPVEPEPTATAGPNPQVEPEIAPSLNP